MSSSQLECLRTLDTILVSTEREHLRLITGYEGKVRYVIKASTGETLFVATEEIMSCCGGTHIDIILHDIRGQDIFHIFRSVEECGNEVIKIKDTISDNVIGKCKQKARGKRTDIKNEYGEKILVIKKTWGMITEIKIKHLFAQIRSSG